MRMRSPRGNARLFNPAHHTLAPPLRSRSTCGFAGVSERRAPTTVPVALRVAQARFADGPQACTEAPWRRRTRTRGSLLAQRSGFVSASGSRFAAAVSIARAAASTAARTGSRLSRA